MERMYGVTFGNKHSYNDWGIYWNGYSEDSPEPQRLLFEVPYRNGLLDATRALTDKIFYKSRKINFDFIVYDNNRTWPEIRSLILGDVHGRSLHVTLDTDLDYYWDAYNCTISTPSAEEEFLKFSIECECFPYKLKKQVTEKTILVNDTDKVLICPNSRMEVNPTFLTDVEVQVKYTTPSGTLLTLAMGPGTHTFDNIEFVRGANTLVFNKITNNATVKVSYQEGEL